MKKLGSGIVFEKKGGGGKSSGFSDRPEETVTNSGVLTFFH